MNIGLLFFTESVAVSLIMWLMWVNNSCKHAEQLILKNAQLVRILDLQLWFEEKPVVPTTESEDP